MSIWMYFFIYHLLGKWVLSLVWYIVRCPDCMVSSFFTYKTAAGTKSTRNSTFRVGGYTENTSRYSFNASASLFFSLLQLALMAQAKKRWVCFCQEHFHALITEVICKMPQCFRVGIHIPTLEQAAHINFFEHIILALCLLK